MHYIGVDYHKRYLYIVVKDRDGKVERRGTMNNSREEFQRFLEPYQPGLLNASPIACKSRRCGPDMSLDCTF